MNTLSFKKLKIFLQLFWPIKYSLIIYNKNNNFQDWLSQRIMILKY